MTIIKRILQAECRHYRRAAINVLVHLHYLSLTDMG